MSRREHFEGRNASPSKAHAGPFARSVHRLLWILWINQSGPGVSLHVQSGHLWRRRNIWTLTAHMRLLAAKSRTIVSARHLTGVFQTCILPGSLVCLCLTKRAGEHQ